MGESQEKRSSGFITIAKLWIIRFIVGSIIAMSAKKIDSYLDAKYGPSDYDKKIVEIWDSVKNIF